MATHAQGSILAPQLLELNLSPAEVADGLRHLPSLVVVGWIMREIFALEFIQKC